nr:MAG TPA: hypothetical protein [Caudoviricetes sp.]
MTCQPVFVYIYFFYAFLSYCSSISYNVTDINRN